MISAGLLLLAYLVGGVPFAVPVVRLLRGQDVQTSGSGNVGARNSMRVGGPLAGILVLSLDGLKAAALILLARKLTGDPWFAGLAGAMVVLGHCFSPYMIVPQLRRSWPGWSKASLLVGGMGLASGLGALLVLAPWAALPMLLLGFAVFKLVVGTGTESSTLAGITMALAAPLLAAAWGYPASAIGAIVLMAIIILSKHVSHIGQP